MSTPVTRVEVLSHTPGPWEATWGNGVTGPRAAFGPYMPTGKDAFDRIPIRRGDCPVAWVISQDEPREALMADARLIAAAPELLELAKRIVREVSPNGGYYKLFDAACALIIKAEGRS